MAALDLAAERKTMEADLEASHQEATRYKSPYERWKTSQGLPTIRAFSVANVYEVGLTPWEARGGSGVFINLDGSAGFNDSYVYELAPKESSAPIRHIYDELIFVLSGHGATTIWNHENKKQTFEWRKGSYFALPPNASHQFFNLSGDEPARYFAMTAAPRVIDTFKNLDFIFNNPYQFDDRFNDDDGYFHEAERLTGRGEWKTNFVADVWGLAGPKRASAEEVAQRARAGLTTVRGSVGASAGEGGRQVAFVGGTVRCGISFGSQPGVHTAFHRHGPGIHVLTIGGHGYSLLKGPEGGDFRRVDWGPGTIFVPPEMWWHAHFNTGPEPWDWLRIGWGTDKPKPGGGQYDYTRSPKDGGDQIPFEEDGPELHREFEEELRRKGTADLMFHHPYCSVK